MSELKNVFVIEKKDIVLLKSDALVIFTDSMLKESLKSCSDLYDLAGEKLINEIKLISSHIGILEEGEAIIAKGGNLFYNFVIHTVLPLKENKLSKCIINCFNLAKVNDVKKIIFSEIDINNISIEEAFIKKLYELSENDKDLLEVKYIVNDETRYIKYKGMF